MRVASIQVQANDLEDYQQAWERLERKIREAAPDHDLILVPECAYPAYFLQDEEDLAAALSFAEQSVAKIKEIARLAKSYIAFGYVEQQDGLLYNTALLIDRNGGDVVKKRKSFLWHFDYKRFTEGNDIAVADTDFGRVGLVVCADARMPELVRMAALEGAELIIDLANLTATGPDITALQNAQSAYMLSVRSLENQVWLAVSDKWGVEADSITYVGRSGIYSPDGTCVYQAGSDKDDTASVEIPTDADGKILRTRSQINITRRPELYGVLTQPTDTLPISSLIDEPVAPSQISPFIAVASGDFDEEGYASMIRRLAYQDSKLICMPPVRFNVAEHADQFRHLLGPDVVLAATMEDGSDTMTTYLVTGTGIQFVYHTLHTGTHGAAANTNPSVYEAKWGRIGIIHGAEALLPEWPRVLMLLGADCVIWPNSLDAGFAGRIARTRAAENRMFVVSAQPSRESNGLSQIVDPNGVVLASTLHSESRHACGALVSFANSRVKEIVPGTHVVKNRHPENYGRLTM